MSSSLPARPPGSTCSIAKRANLFGPSRSTLFRSRKCRAKRAGRRSRIRQALLRFQGRRSPRKISVSIFRRTRPTHSGSGCSQPLTRGSSHPSASTTRCIFQRVTAVCSLEERRASRPEALSMSLRTTTPVSSGCCVPARTRVEAAVERLHHRPGKSCISRIARHATAQIDWAQIMEHRR